ncbi:MAG: DUF3445 domain-containing protein, partial [Rhodoferax sp.]|nr:DUF3445 domain-containing protein [Rhodoferax sp.]
PGAAQLTANRIGDAALRQKVAILSRDADAALLAVPGFDAEPAIQALLRHCAREHPDAIRIDAHGRVTAMHLGWSLDGMVFSGNGPADVGQCLAAISAPWRLTALLCLAFAEDFAVIEAIGGRIPWMAVCLPSQWVPRDKLGLEFTQVHAPVADNQTLLAAGDHLARLVTGEPRWERFVWTITRAASLDNHPLRVPKQEWPTEHQADARQLAAAAFWRTERQTFIPLPELGQALFTIHVQVEPLAQAVSMATQARALHAALGSMSQAVLDYRGLTPARDRLLQWLEERAASGGVAFISSPAP